MRARRLNSILTSIADTGWGFVAHRLAGKKPDLESLCRDLLSNRGEASGIAIARKVVESYLALDDDAKAAYLGRLAHGFQCKPEDVDHAIEAYQAEPSPLNLKLLAKATESPRIRLFKRVNMAPNGIRAILTMRAFIIDHLKAHPDWRDLDDDVRHLLEGWFNPGFLSLTRIDWHSPASLLERLKENEKVHEIGKLEDLRRRLAGDRRCFAFFHPTLPDEPLIFVQVALVKGIAQSVMPLLDQDSPVLPVGDADTAIFYSISTCEEGLRGVSLGNFLIKRVVSLLKEELPHIKTFSTLSPVPGLNSWLKKAALDHPIPLIQEKAVLALKQAQSVDWQDDGGNRRNQIELCAHYLVREKRHHLPLDPVARFHLGNGARLERVNWLGDLSDNGIAQSSGILVNYLYDEASIERNHEALVNAGEVMHSHPVKKLLPTLPKVEAAPRDPVPAMAEP